MNQCCRFTPIQLLNIIISLWINYVFPNCYWLMQYNHKCSYMNNKNYYSYKCMNILFHKYENIKFIKFFFEKNKLKNDTMNESELQKVYNYPIYPRNSKTHSDKGFIDIDNGSQGGTHWTCFIVKDNISYYFDSFGGQPDNFLLKQLPNPKKYKNY